MFGERNDACRIQIAPSIIFPISLFLIPYIYVYIKEAVYKRQAMAHMDSELIYGQIPWAIVTFLQAGFKGSQRLIHDMLLYFLYGTPMYLSLIHI